MASRRLALSDLPAWPRFLTRAQAAAYLGVSSDLFDKEVAAGLWPAGRQRGAKGGLLTWDRVALDRRADAALPSSAPADDFEERRRAAEISRREQGDAPAGRR
jgi:hypothetical protein